MKPITRWLLILVAGLILLAAPAVIREWGLGYNQRAYEPPVVPTAAIAATPEPTDTPAAIEAEAEPPQNELKRGPVVVDLAHLSPIQSSRFQPLAAALAARGLDLIYWMPSAAPGSVEDVTDLPDLSAELGAYLADASALVVVSPLYAYNPTEVAIVEQFVRDGGRLLLISDPDVEGDHARDSNVLAAPFNIVFNEDYLYDTVDNDENYTHFFQGGFFDRAAGLEGSHVAFYGGRSVGGAILPQVRSANTTLSSLRNGLTGFTTVAVGGQLANKSLGRVLAMSDFDVLTDPYVARHDNRQLLEFVASFLTGAQRENTIEDFPAFLGKEVALVIDNTEPVGAAGLAKAAELQRFLEASGRTLTLAPNSWLNEEEGEPGLDLLYVGGYRAADSMTTLLHDLGINLVEVTVTPTAAPAAPAAEPGQDFPAEQATPEPRPDDSEQESAATMTPEATAAPTEPLPAATPSAPAATPNPTATPQATMTAAVDQPSAVQPVTATVPVKPTSIAAGEVQPALEETLAPTATVAETLTEPVGMAATATPEVILYLERKDGIRLVADETQLFIQRPYHGDQKILAILGNSEAAINSGVTRLLNRDLAGCLAQEELIICPYTGGEGAVSGPPSSPRTPTPTPAATQSVGMPLPDAPGKGQKVLLVDDNSGAGETERSEAAVYLMALTEAGYMVDLWTTSEDDFPDDAKLAEYRWVIWSDAGYEDSGISGESLRLISNYINQGGHVTVSSRVPFFGLSNRPPSPIKDIALDNDVPELVAGLPTEPIQLAGNLPDVTPLESNPEPSTGARIALRRGADSDAADAPVLVIYSDVNFEEPKGALLMLFGMSIAWLPDEVAPQLVRNMATVMLAE